MTNEQKILNALCEHLELSKSELKDICKASEYELNLCLNALVFKNKIKRVKQGVYALDKQNYIDPKQGDLFS